MFDDRNCLDAEWLQQLRKTYLSTAPKKMAELERAVSAIERSPDNPLHQQRLRKFLHNLIGSGGSYGFPEVSDIAREMSEYLKCLREANFQHNADTLAVLRSYLKQLRDIFNEAES